MGVESKHKAATMGYMVAPLLSVSTAERTGKNYVT